ncbi:MAG TPA: tetratricopeptide repeat protein [Anaeromyxobacteraceae bacterium]|nr:tetratricopeptide repeat protein [Anaeromyxobacteraceae bacterium]
MNRSLVAVAVALAIAGCKKNEPVVAAPIAPAAGGMPAAPAPGGMPPGAMPPPGTMPPPGGGMPPGGMMGASNNAGAASFDQQIALTRQMVEKDPKNVQAWVTLGNLYFDSFKAGGDRQRAQASVDAYGKALELAPNNPDVLTDQGVMYRDLGQNDKALANFLKANQIAPGHMQSLMNAGVVYSETGQPKKAEEAWMKVIATDKTGQFASQAGNAIAQLRQQPGGMAVPAPQK